MNMALRVTEESLESSKSFSLAKSFYKRKKYHTFNNPPEGNPILTTPVDLQSGTGEPTEYEKESVMQAVVFIEDAIKYRSIYHKTDIRALWYYQIYYSTWVQAIIQGSILVIHLLAFLETPSSLTKSSNPLYGVERPELPCGITEGIEVICILVFCADLCFKVYMVGTQYFVKKRWLVAYLVVLILYSVNLLTTLCLLCSQNIRFRRLLRPFFLLQNSSLMKKTVRCLKNTLPQIASVLLLLLFHLFFYTMLGMLILPNNEKVLSVIIPGSLYANVTLEDSDMYFSSLSGSIFNLFVLLTTANNPDLMIPWYSKNRLYAIFFISYMIIGIYCLMNMLTAITYNQFRGYFMSSMQSSVVRRKVGIQVAFEVLKEVKPKREVSFHVKREAVSVSVLKDVLQRVSLHAGKKEWMLQKLESEYNQVELDLLVFHDFFRLLDKEKPLKRRPSMIVWESRIMTLLQKIIAHKYISWLSFVILVINVVCITIELSLDYKSLMSSGHSLLAIVNLLFISYYVLELVMKIVFIGYRHYFWDGMNIFDCLLTIVLCILELIFIVFYGSPFSKSKESFVLATFRTLWTIVRIINIIIVCRLLRVVAFIRSMLIITSVLVDIIKNLRAFIGILVVAYYCFALLGVELFQGMINNLRPLGNATFICGTYEENNFWSQNFDDFAAAIVVLWDIMVVNNWHIIANGYARASDSSWPYAYFITWYLVALVFCMNLLTAFILENFIMKWDRLNDEDSDVQEGGLFRLSSLHDMFRSLVTEPSTEQLHEAVLKHHYLSLRSGSQASEPTTSFR